MPRPSKPFLDRFLSGLTDPEEAAEYIMAARKDSLEMFRTAIRDVAQAHQMAKVAKRSGVTRENLYRAFSEHGNPTLDTLDSVLFAVGLELAVVPVVPKKGKSSPSSMMPSRRGRRKVTHKELQNAGQLTLPLVNASRVTFDSQTIAEHYPSVSMSAFMSEPMRTVNQQASNVSEMFWMMAQGTGATNQPLSALQKEMR